MLFFAVTRFHAYTLDLLIADRCGGTGVLPVPISYEELFGATLLPAGAWLFTDLERLSPQERVMAAAVYRAMAARPDRFRPLNDPARARMRFPLLRALHAAGINGFTAYRANAAPRPARFPVFLKSEAEHAPALGDLLPDQTALEAALEATEAAGRPLDDLVAIEFAAEPSAPGVWTRHTAFAVEGEPLLDLPVTEGHWMVKTGTIGLVGDDVYAVHDEMVRENRFADVLREAFRLARIGFGRLDFGLLGGVPQIYEINTNPNFGGLLPPHPSTVRQGTREFAWARLTRRLAQLAAAAPRGEAVALEVPGLQEWREQGAEFGWRP